MEQQYYQSNNNPNASQPNHQAPAPNLMETAALIFSIIALATSCCLYSSLFCGALSIIFALLSRGANKKMSPKSRTAFGLGIAAIVTTLVIYIAMFATTISYYGSFDNMLDEMRTQYPEFEEYLDVYDFDYSTLFHAQE